MYKVEFLPAARKDMIGIARYISEELSNPGFADQLAEEMIQAAEEAAEMPYKNPAYLPVRPLKHEYRTILVRKYLMFYWTEEETKTVLFARVIYAGRAIDRFLH